MRQPRRISAKGIERERREDERRREIKSGCGHDADSTEFRGGRGALPIHSGERCDPRHIQVRFENIGDSIESGAAISVSAVETQCRRDTGSFHHLHRFLTNPYDGNPA
jgi:hypothetical protein